MQRWPGIYFTSDKGLTAVKAEDGTELWRFDLPSCDGPSLALPKQGKVFVGGNDGNLYAIDAKTGKKLWASDFISDAPPDPPNFSGERADGEDQGETIFPDERR